MKYFSGKYSCLKVELIFKREFSYYMLTIYVPCCMLVIVSWVSFWLDQNAIPARVSLGVTTLLTMSTQTSGINAQLPPVSYTKAIDVWTGVRNKIIWQCLLRKKFGYLISSQSEMSDVIEMANRDRSLLDFRQDVILYQEPAFQVLCTRTALAQPAIQLFQLFFWKKKRKNLLVR